MGASNSIEMKTMKLYKTTLTPQSNFATPIRGDTLFGQLCWMIRYVFGEERLEALLSDYGTAPFLVASDVFASGYLPKPKLPAKLLGEDSEKKKANRKKIWLTQEELQNGDYLKARSDKQIDNQDRDTTVMHNSIHYKHFRTTDDGAFAPYGQKEFSLAQKDLYFLVDTERFSLSELEETLMLLSQTGYGKDATIGRGRFVYGDFEEVSVEHRAKSFMVLSPFSPQGLECEALYCEPFTRFGKLGAQRAYTNAFKKPILMADTGSVVHFEEAKRLFCLGSAITNVSSAYPDAVHQGYAVALPIKEL